MENTPTRRPQSVWLRLEGPKPEIMYVLGRLYLILWSLFLLPSQILEESEGPAMHPLVASEKITLSWAESLLSHCPTHHQGLDKIPPWGSPWYYL